jgi:hypothetical protein
MGRQETYELESHLHDVYLEGFGIFSIYKIYRLLGKGNRAAGTWAALLDVWESLGYEKSNLHIAEIAKDKILLSLVATDPITKWTKP